MASSILAMRSTTPTRRVALARLAIASWSASASTQESPMKIRLIVGGLPRKLSTQDAPTGMAPKAGELTHYAPWGNLAIFIKPRAYSRSLLPLGKVNDGG